MDLVEQVVAELPGTVLVHIAHVVVEVVGHPLFELVANHHQLLHCQNAFETPRQFLVAFTEQRLDEVVHFVIAVHAL